jgi:hypothetical protein
VKTEAVKTEESLVKTEESLVKTETVEKTATTWRTFFARLFPMLSCTSEVAVSVQ